ncbi:dynamin family protein, partial [Endozoicomonas sp. ONNA2]|uniref:dynamin family protein n=1 Tax=Endozoicomonas sp. ONNA2 TaxID=2828741 RepID=UPI0021498D8E
MHQTSIHPNYNGSIQPHNFHNGLHNGFNPPEETQFAGHPRTHSSSFQEKMLEIHQNVLELMKQRNDVNQFLQALRIDRKTFATNQQLLNHLISTYPALAPVLEELSPGNIMITGPQSSGKTSFFATISGLKTAIKCDTASTKQPIVYTFVSSDHFHATIQDGDDPETRTSYKSTESLNIALSRSQEKIPETLRLKPLLVRIEGRQFIDMTVVDFPGDVPGNEKDEALRQELYKRFDNENNILIRVGKGDGDPNNDYRLQLLLKNLKQKFKFVVLTHIGPAVTKQRQIAQYEGAKPMFSTGFLNPQMPMFGVECSIKNVEAICDVEGNEREAVWERLDTELRKTIDYELTETRKETGIQKLKFIPGCFGTRTLQALLEYIQFHIQQETLNHLASEMLPNAIYSELIISDRAIKDAKSIELAYLNLFKKHFSHSALDNAFKKGYDIMEDKFELTVKSSVFGPALLLPSLLDRCTDKENLSLLRAMEKMHEGQDDKELNDQCNQQLIDTVAESLGKLINILNYVIPQHSVTPTKFVPEGESDIAVDVPSVVQVIEREKHAEVVGIAHDHIIEFFNAYFSRLYYDKELLADLERAGFSREESYQVFRKIQTGFSRFTKEEFVVLKAKLPRINGGVYAAEYTKLEKKYRNLFAALGIRQNSDKNKPNLTKSSWKNLRPHDKRQLRKWALILAGGALAITTTAAITAITGPVAPIVATAAIGGGAAAHKAHKKHSAKKALKEAAIEGGNAAGKAALSAATSGAKGALLAGTASGAAG